MPEGCLLYTSDAADERSSVDLGGRRIIKKKKTIRITGGQAIRYQTKYYIIQQPITDRVDNIDDQLWPAHRDGKKCE